jgi:L-lactate dehydrogenase (cytochrome)
MPSSLNNILSLADFEAHAKRILPSQLFAYVSGGCEDGQSLSTHLISW